YSLKNLFVRYAPGGINNAKKSKIRISSILNPLRGSRGDVNDVAPSYGIFLFIDVHQSFAGKDVIYFGRCQPVWPRSSLWWQSRMRKAVPNGERFLIRM